MGHINRAISFGLVAIPIKLYTAAVSAGVSFHLLHATCGHRIRQQTYCPVDHAVVERGELVKGYEVAKDQYVTVTEAELQALEGAASTVIDHPNISASTAALPKALRAASSFRTRAGRSFKAATPTDRCRMAWAAPARRNARPA